jgi:photosystem II stability/assembly factor-like uncharacterized protein
VYAGLCAGVPGAVEPEVRVPADTPLSSVIRAWAVGLLVGAAAAAAPVHDVPASTYSDMHWRLVGPFRAGWATVTAGVPGDPATWYFGTADGGVWTTDDAGVTWLPLFDHQGSASIGALALAPSDPRVVWVGTGQVQQRWDIVDGDGVYRSTDGGVTWSHVGLADSKHIGSIWVDPHDPDVVVVAALGHVFGPNPERGLFRTDDAGRHWTHVVDRGPDVGAADIAGDPAHPDVLYASLWQVRRHPWLDYFQPTVGPGSGIVKSTDGGRTWSAVGSRGLPTGPLGRIELAVAPGTSSQRVWASIELPRDGGLWRSDDGGASWQQLNTDASLASNYTGGLTADPKNPDILWAMGRSLRRSEDGGRTFRVAKGAPGGDDYHFLWIDPTDPERMITGADQGAVLTLNGGRSWSSWYNQPTGQFYRLAVDDRFPYWIYSGQQDSGTVAIASRSDYGQLTFRDWHPVGGDERDADIPDPTTPDIVYGAGLGGRLSKWDAKTGQVQNVSPWPVASYSARPGATRYRYDWLTPIAISPRAPHAVYQGAQMLFRSLDGGRSWQTVSPDLTGADPNATGCSGDVPVDRASACGFGTIFAISPSPAADGVIWVGTTNGRVQLTRDDCTSWHEVTPKGLADWSKVNIIDASPTDPGTAYIAADRHRLDDFTPSAYRTHDFGATWTEIGHGLPAGAWVGVVRQDARQAELLYAGTSRGVWVSFDDGDHWRSLQLDLPTTGINDLLQHGDDLIAATEGRAIWVLDQLAPLRALAANGIPTGPVLVPPGTAYRLRSNSNKDTPLPPEEPRGGNPPVGAVLDYVLPAHTSGAVTLEIDDRAGQVIRRFSSDDEPEKATAAAYFSDLFLAPPQRLAATPGHHRFVWNLRYRRPRTLRSSYSIAAIPGRETPVLPLGAFVLPGRYRVRMTADGVTLEQPLEVAVDPRVTVREADLEALLALQRRVYDGLARSADIAEQSRTARARLEKALADRWAAGLRKRIERVLHGLEALPVGRYEEMNRVNRVLASLATDLESADAAPTEPQREVLTLAVAGIDRYEPRWRTFAAGPLAALERRLAALGL